MLRRIAYSALALLLCLAAVAGVRTLRYGPPPAEPVPPAAGLEIDPARTAETLAQALRIRTISYGADQLVDAASFAELHGLLRAAFPRVDRAMSRETVAGHSLLYTWPGSDPGLAPILFSAHMDVVPVEPGTEADWTHPAFAGAVADGFVWGRGALDMKNALMAQMEAAEALLAEGFAPKRTILFAFTHDEELDTTGARAIAALLEARGVRLSYTLDEGLVIADGIVPGVARPVALIGVAQKGYVTVELTARGAGGHSSMPPAETVGARLSRAVLAVAGTPMPARLDSPVAEMFEYLAPEMGPLNRMALANRWLFGPLVMAELGASPASNALIRTTVAPTILQSGVKANILPQQGRAVLNIRILPGRSIAGTLEDIRARIADPEIGIRVMEGDSSEPSPVAALDSASFRMLLRTVRQVFPDAVPAPGLMIGTTDSSRYGAIAANRYLFLPARLTDADLRRMHGTDERIAVADYAAMIRFYAQLIRNTAAGNGAGG